MFFYVTYLFLLQDQNTNDIYYIFIQIVASLSTIKSANYSAALFQQINLPLSPLLSVKFLPHGPGHIAILNENYFFIFDLEKNIDNPEIIINLKEKNEGNKFEKEEEKGIT